MKQEPLDGSPLMPSFVLSERRGHTRKTHKRLRDAGALYAHHLNTDLVQFKRAEDGSELWAWAEFNKDPFPGKQGMSWQQASAPTEGQLVLVYDPDCLACPGELEGCHYCHAPYNTSGCPICGRGLFMTDRHGWSGTQPVRQYYSNPEDVEADLDAVPFHELAEYGELPCMVATALVEWRESVYGEGLYHHNVATFLDILAGHGYGVVKIEAPDLGTLLPAPEGNTQ